jgi:F-type H+-transporting ATPase subunit b
MGLVTPNPGTLFWMVIIFGIVFLILRKFAWKPILNALKDRENTIANALNSAEQARKDVEGLKADNDRIILQAKKEKDLILKEAKDLKDKILAEAKVKAVSETQKSIDQARQQIQAEKVAAITEIKNQVAELSVMIAEKILQSELKNKGEQERVVNNALKDIKLN